MKQQHDPWLTRAISDVERVFGRRQTVPVRAQSPKQLQRFGKRPIGALAGMTRI